MQMGRYSRALVVGGAWLVTGFLLLPMLITVPMSFSPDDFLAVPTHDFSLRHYRSLYSNPVWSNAIWESLVTASGAMVLATVIGTMAAIGLWINESRFARMLNVVPLLPLLVPGVVSALALSRLWSFFGMLDTRLAVIVSQAILAIPIVFIIVAAALQGLDPRIVQASRSLGGGIARTVLQIIVPNLKAGMLSSALFAFLVSWDEVVVTSFIASRHVFTLPLKIFSDLRNTVDPAVAAISSLIIAATIVVALVMLAKNVLSSKGNAVHD